MNVSVKLTGGKEVMDTITLEALEKDYDNAQDELEAIQDTIRSLETDEETLEEALLAVNEISEYNSNIKHHISELWYAIHSELNKVRHTLDYANEEAVKAMALVVSTFDAYNGALGK